MTLLAESKPVGGYDDDVPIDLNQRASGADRVFRMVLAAAALAVLVILVSVMVFLLVKGWSALEKAGFGLFGTTWAPELGRYGMLPLLAGSMAIAVVSLIIAFPISVATALLINEYLPARVRPWLISLIDLLATVPTIVYGFWGLEVVSQLQVGPAEWLVQHFSFVPFFRTPEPGNYADSVFAVSLVCAVTIIPIITSVSRDVMSQAPRDACEAALGLGGTRWGMVTDVILPFSRRGLVSAGLLGLGRGLGETMIVVLILSSANKLTPALMGPQGLGSIAREITENFVSGSTATKSALVLIALVLLVSTLVVNAISRLVVNRATRAA